MSIECGEDGEAMGPPPSKSPASSPRRHPDFYVQVSPRKRKSRRSASHSRTPSRTPSPSPPSSPTMLPTAHSHSTHTRTHAQDTHTPTHVSCKLTHHPDSTPPPHTHTQKELPSSASHISTPIQALPNTNTPPHTPRHVVFLANVHLYWDPAMHDVKLAQSRYLLRKVMQFRERILREEEQGGRQDRGNDQQDQGSDTHTQGGSTAQQQQETTTAEEEGGGGGEERRSVAAAPLVDCGTMLIGDFNTTPQEPSYLLFSMGTDQDFLNPSSLLGPPAASPAPTHTHLPHALLTDNPCDTQTPTDHPHSTIPPTTTLSDHETPPSLLPLNSAYADVLGRELPFSNYTQKFKGLIDYIWFTPHQRLSCTAVQLLPPMVEMQQQTALPNEVHPSDHLPLQAMFSLIP
eukprot:gnl/Trimastix_PCT/4928.p1 GENE.gnl/Trimastix_PCT/4928~~gnl/Trimastix_PCT/4928.p1  ORF type:complete len:403 (+),score=74.01 gnl/Trimastix_PCT/4928:184-1392(+)